MPERLPAETEFVAVPYTLRAELDQETVAGRASPQYHAWWLFVVQRRSYLHISRTLDLPMAEVKAMIAAEGELRAQETAALRQIEIQKSIATYEKVEAWYLRRMNAPSPKGDEGRYAVQARQRIDALYGLDAPLRVDSAAAPAQNLLVALGDQGVVALLQYIAKRRTQVTEGV